MTWLSRSFWFRNPTVCLNKKNLQKFVRKIWINLHSTIMKKSHIYCKSLMTVVGSPIKLNHLLLLFLNTKIAIPKLVTYQAHTKLDVCMRVHCCNFFYLCWSYDGLAASTSHQWLLWYSPVLLQLRLYANEGVSVFCPL